MNLRYTLPMPSPTNSPIGVFDSGVGGISVLRAIREQMPGEWIIYTRIYSGLKLQSAARMSDMRT